MRRTTGRALLALALVGSSGFAGCRCWLPGRGCIDNADREAVLAELVPEGRRDCLARLGLADRNVPIIDSEIVQGLPSNHWTLSSGRDAGVQEEMEFMVYRGDSFVGRLRVEDVADQTCTARLLFSAAGMQPEVGDPCATRIR